MSYQRFTAVDRTAPILLPLTRSAYASLALASDTRFGLSPEDGLVTPYSYALLAPDAGFEPATRVLTGRCSAVELIGKARTPRAWYQLWLPAEGLKRPFLG